MSDMNVQSLLRAIFSLGQGRSTTTSPLYKAATGFDTEELSNLSKKTHPDVRPGSQHHALASFLTAMNLRNAMGGAPGGDAMAMILPQLGGLAVEGAEAYGLASSPHGTLKQKFGKHWQEDTIADLLANLKGAGQAVYGGR